MFDTAVVACHFNWASFKRPVVNLHRFMEKYPDAYGTELVLPGKQPVTTCYKNWVQIEASADRHILFQKEALFNLTVSRLPPYISKVAFLDADLIFEDDTWLQRCREMLDYSPIIQPFSTCTWLNHDNKIVRVKPSVLSDPAGLLSGFRSHPGFAWCARRTFWTSSLGGLYPYCFIGSGDTALALATLGLEPTRFIWPHPPSRAHCAQWCRDLQAWSGKRFTYVTGNVNHMFHGTLENRRYAARTVHAKDVDVQSMLCIDDKGLLAWTAEADSSHKESVIEYFEKRNEDEDMRGLPQPETVPICPPQPTDYYY